MTATVNAGAVHFEQKNGAPVTRQTLVTRLLVPRLDFTLIPGLHQLGS